MGLARTTRLMYRARAAAYLHALVSALLLLWTGTVGGAVRFPFFGAYRLLHPFVPVLALHVAQPAPVHPLVHKHLLPWALGVAVAAALLDATYAVVHMGVRTLGGSDAALWTTFPYILTLILTLVHAVLGATLALAFRALRAQPPCQPEEVHCACCRRIAPPASRAEIDLFRKAAVRDDGSSSSSSSNADPRWRPASKRPVLGPNGATVYVEMDA